MSQLQGSKYSTNGKLRKHFNYLPVIPWLKAMLANSAHATKMCYRAEYMHEPDFSRTFLMVPITSLCSTPLSPLMEPILFFFFSDECDISLGLLTDGFAPFKRHDVTRWTIILFNYNLPPEICFLKKYCIHIATVLGPK